MLTKTATTMVQIADNHILTCCLKDSREEVSGIHAGAVTNHQDLQNIIGFGNLGVLIGGIDGILYAISENSSFVIAQLKDITVDSVCVRKTQSTANGCDLAIRNVGICQLTEPSIGNHESAEI